MTYTLQELETLCSYMSQDVHRALPEPYAERYLSFPNIAAIAIPELIARIKELDPDYHAAPPIDSVSRAQSLMREAAEKRAKLEKALADAKMGDLRELNAMGLEAFFDEDGQVKIRQKARATT
jgi:hypothetical protein